MNIKTTGRKILLGLTLSFTVLGMAACGTVSMPVSAADNIVAQSGEIETATEPEAQPSDLTVVDQGSSTPVNVEAPETTISIPSSTELSQLESEGLIFMREEEKLARDVYLTLANAWNLNIFQNIASSEQTHSEAVKTLLDRYGLEDPVVNDEVGVFTNPDLQALYDKLAAQGSQSLGEALNVGATIEEIDILDLEDYIAQTDKADIQLVYENLLKGSRNHLRAFVSTIQKQTGSSYQPQYLSQEAYQAIVGSEIESGGNGRRWGRR
ncbi:MAG: DUF2202 domain-containing protein [Anaerolineales bacterium]